MKRIHLFEFEDQKWFPQSIRTGMTNLLVVLHKMVGTKYVISDLIGRIRHQQHFDQIVDLGSGSGGIMPEVVDELNRNSNNNPLQLLLTDLHPNKNAIAQFNSRINSEIKYHESSIDAAAMDQLPSGLKTMVNSFHHIPPHTAKKILTSAQESQQPFLIYEMGENKIPTGLWWLLLPLSISILFVMALFMTPFVRPLSWKQLLFTYLIPIIPLCYSWDGQVSIVRMYTFEDIHVLLNDILKPNYKWEMAQAKKANGKTLGYYILGFPM